MLIGVIIQSISNGVLFVLEGFEAFILNEGTLGLLRNPGFSWFQATGTRTKGFLRYRPDNRL